MTAPHEWQPIATCPEDGADVLVTSQSGRVSIETPMHIQRMRVAAVKDGEECWYVYWQPLPPAATVPDSGEVES